jgi:hypothetical protein
VPVNWHQLFADVLAWNHPDGYVQKQWARAFWARPKPQVEAPQSEQLVARMG